MAAWCSKFLGYDSINTVCGTIFMPPFAGCIASDGGGQLPLPESAFLTVQPRLIDRFDTNS